MVHKIKGWARDFADHGTGYELGNGGGWAEFIEDGKEEFGDVPCTLITTHDRVFTESEVRAMLEAGRAMHDELNGRANSLTQTGNDGEASSLYSLLARWEDAGGHFDPA
jgi:hypothetical protein